MILGPILTYPVYLMLVWLRIIPHDDFPLLPILGIECSFMYSLVILHLITRKIPKVEKKNSADSYIDTDLQLTGQSDTYTHQTQTRIWIGKSDSFDEKDHHSFG